MSEEVIVRFKYTFEEQRSGLKWHYRMQYPRIVHVFFWGAVCMMIFSGSYTTLKFGTDAGGLSVLLYGIGIVAYFRIFYPWILKRQFLKRPDHNSQIEWRVSESGIKSKTSHGHAEQSWAAFSKIAQTKDGFLFYPNARIFHWLPRLGFASDADFDRVSQLAQKNVSSFKTAK